MSRLTQTPTIDAIYSPPVTAPSTTTTHTPSASSSSTPTSPSLSPSPSPSLSHCHQLPPLPAHFTFPAVGSYSDSSLLRCEWSEHGYRMNVPHLSDLSVLIDTTGTDTALVHRIAAAGYSITEECGSSFDGGSRTLLRLTCHRVVLSTASRVLRTIIHDGNACGAPPMSAATSLTFGHCPLVPLLWLLHYLYSATVVASISLGDLVPTMQLARYFQVYPLLAACEQRASKLVSLHSLHLLWTAATRLYEGLVVNVCTDFIVAHMRDVLFCEHFSDLPSFLRECIGGLLHDSQQAVKDEDEREELIRLFQSRQQQPKDVKAEELQLIAAITSSPIHPSAVSVTSDSTLTQLVREQKAQPLFDALTSLCSLYFTPPAVQRGKTRREADRKADSVDDIAASFGRPPPVKLYAEDEDDSDSDSDWDSDDEEATNDSPPSAVAASSLWTKQSELPTPPSLTSPRYRLHEKMESAAGCGASKLSEGLPDLTVETASRPPRHPATRHTRDRSCPLRQEQYMAAIAQHVQLLPVRARRPSAPAAF